MEFQVFKIKGNQTRSKLDLKVFSSVGRLRYLVLEVFLKNLNLISIQRRAIFPFVDLCVRRPIKVLNLMTI